MLMLCDDCDTPIYPWENFYGIDGACLCPDCFDLWADNHKFVAVERDNEPFAVYDPD